MNRAVGRCSETTRQGPAKCFSPSPSILKIERHGRTDRTRKKESVCEREREKHPDQPGPAHAHGVVRASFSWPPFPIFFPTFLLLICRFYFLAL
jgi:hypothetical protein